MSAMIFGHLSASCGAVGEPMRLAPAVAPHETCALHPCGEGPLQGSRTPNTPLLSPRARNIFRLVSIHFSMQDRSRIAPVSGHAYDLRRSEIFFLTSFPPVQNE